MLDYARVMPFLLPVLSIEHVTVLNPLVIVELSRLLFFIGVAYMESLFLIIGFIYFFEEYRHLDV